MEFAYHVVDVFTTTPMQGNALAVFPDATGMESATMQRVARELNLSETTFILPRESQEGAARVRIFTPASELPFAGHPTIGTAFIMRRLGIVEADAQNFALSENVGRVPIRVDAGEDPILWLTTPPIRKLAEFSRDRCARALSLGADRLVPGVPCEQLSAGSPLIFVAVKERADVDAAQLDGAIYSDLVRPSREADLDLRFRADREGRVLADVRAATRNHRGSGDRRRNRSARGVHDEARPRRERRRDAIRQRTGREDGPAQRAARAGSRRERPRRNRSRRERRARRTGYDGAAALIY